MDELTRERFGRGVPYAERYARPNPVPKAPGWVIRARRLVLSGTADLEVLERGGSIPGSARHRRLLEAIRRSW